MRSIDNALAFTPHQEYCWYGAYRSVHDAISALESAGAALRALAADTLWQADGVRALNAAIDALAPRCGASANELRARQWELQAAHE